MPRDRDGESPLNDEPAADTYRARFDPDTEPIDAVVDPIVLVALVRRHRRPVRLSFEFDDHVVRVDSRGEISLRADDRRTAAGISWSFDATESVAVVVASAIISLRGLELRALSPLESLVERDVLDSPVGGSHPSALMDLRVSFRVDGLRVSPLGLS